MAFLLKDEIPKTLDGMDKAWLELHRNKNLSKKLDFYTTSGIQHGKRFGRDIITLAIKLKDSDKFVTIWIKSPEGRSTVEAGFGEIIFTNWPWFIRAMHLAVKQLETNTAWPYKELKYRLYGYASAAPETSGASSAVVCVAAAGSGGSSAVSGGSSAVSGGSSAVSGGSSAISAVSGGSPAVSGGSGGSEDELSSACGIA